MLVEFRVVPMGHHRSVAWDDRQWELLKAAGLRFEQGPMSICLEGDWHQVMGVIHRCHQAAFELASHVVTSITINEMRQELSRGADTTSEALGSPAPHKRLEAGC
jgi:uncharacterized protein YqgV (UPF0045/DUF77 family)